MNCGVVVELLISDQKNRLLLQAIGPIRGSNKQNVRYIAAKLRD